MLTISRFFHPEKCWVAGIWFHPRQLEILNANMICEEMKAINHVLLILLLKYFNFLINALFRTFSQLFFSHSSAFSYDFSKELFRKKINLFIHMIRVKHKHGEIFIYDTVPTHPKDRIEIFRESGGGWQCMGLIMRAK